MGRPPCCNKIGVKKGPWTPEEDITLVSYIQQNGPGNWRSVPTNTAIASYLPQRTDNDIKNYWNTHLKKKLDRLQDNSDQDNHHHHHRRQGNSKGCRQSSSSSETTMSKGQWERRLQTDIHMAKQALCEALSLDNKSINLPEIPPSNRSTTTYASSAENIARLLPNWMNSSKKSSQTSSESMETTQTRSSLINNQQFQSPPSEGYNNLIHNNQTNNYYSNYSNSDVSQSVSPATSVFQDESKPKMEDQMPPLSFLEKWLFDDATAQGDLMNMSLEESDNFF
ncbi:hypothetical protein L1987_44823 [Smallanthus sonchifolius]|uniref:Uncharacterized protein n=1 Tax=Smallanthus sonchifolius TaxID=185202 RepID=A0ACB9GQB7_9ASTR|nr:hypothetical protein L1987_44823 [Smallanthus sonchifolius]